MANPAPSVRVATYNIHKCRGLDGRVRPDRIVAVLREVNADVVGLQEVWSAEAGEAEDNQAAYLAAALGMQVCRGDNRRLRDGAYGNALLSRCPARDCRNFDLTQGRREPRGCLRADFELEGGWPLRVFNLHLGTAYRERRRQGAQLIDAAMLDAGDPGRPRIVLGDFNEWTSGLASRLLAAHFTGLNIRRGLGRFHTYPGLLPFLNLDHIYYDPSLRLERLTLCRTRTALLASDHLPLVADFRLG